MSSVGNPGIPPGKATQIPRNRACGYDNVGLSSPRSFPRHRNVDDFFQDAKTQPTNQDGEPIERYFRTSSLF